MRKVAAALAIGLLASTVGFGASAPQAAAASNNSYKQLKVVLVVGAVEGTTASYIADARAYAAEFRKYTSNVIEVYSPNATWTAVQTAAQGANVLVYLGHGNGYPNPYNSKLYTDRDNGMGLNTSANNGNSDKRYYGEQFMSSLQLAHNAIVMLNHLCYASGNSESGLGLPSLSTAETRVDGYAAGFIGGGAQAVIAEGLGSLNPYIDAIFTSSQTIDSMWRSVVSYHNETTWSSTRSGGYTSAIDPDLAHPQSDHDVYYRSLVTLPGFSTTDIGVVVPPVPATYTALNPPQRALDSRSGPGFTGKLYANGARSFKVGGLYGVPANATAVTGNVTVVKPTSSGAVYVGPTLLNYPTTSALNFAKGQTVGNGLSVALSPTGYLYATLIARSGNYADLVFDVTGFFTPDTSGDTYHPLPPKRIVDSRTKLGLLGGAVPANTPKSIMVRGAGGVLDTAVAVTGNVTATGSTAGYALYLGPYGDAKPKTSTVNFARGQTQGNNLTVALADDGSMSVTFMSSSGGTAQVVFDVTGFYTHDLSGDEYVPLTPARLLDSRNGTGFSGKLSANNPHSLAVRGFGGVLDTATAISGNVTVVNESAGYAAFLGPDNTIPNDVTTLNFSVGQIRGNGFNVKLSDTGALFCTYESTGSNTTDLVVDVTGYFAPVPGS
jgi:hypothetical protein